MWPRIHDSYWPDRLDHSDINKDHIQDKSEPRSKRMDRPFLPSLSLEKMSGLLASLLGTNCVTKSQHGRCGKGPLRLLRILSQVLNISQVGGYSKFQCLPPSSQYIGLRWAHSAGIPEAEFFVSILWWNQNLLVPDGPRMGLPAQPSDLQFAKPGSIHSE